MSDTAVRVQELYGEISKASTIFLYSSWIMDKEAMQLTAFLITAELLNKRFFDFEPYLYGRHA